jgi:ribokinase
LLSLPSFHRNNRFIFILRRTTLPSQKPIVVVGSINTDLVSVTGRIPAVGETVIGTDFHIHPGGKGANQAVAIARLGYPVQLIGRLGNDALGSQLRLHLENSGVNIAGVATSDGTSGVAVIVVSDKGENSIVVTPGANSKVTPHDLETNIDAIRNAGIVLAQLEIPTETVEYLAAICVRENVPLILDPAPATDLPLSIFNRIAWLTPNQSEAAFYVGGGEHAANGYLPDEIAKELLGKGSLGVVLKMGERGVFLASRDVRGTLIPAFKLRAVDTTAAGDAFNGGFATGLMRGKSPAESARFATAVAGISVTRRGAQPSMPSMIEVERLLQSSADGGSPDEFSVMASPEGNPNPRVDGPPVR